MGNNIIEELNGKREPLVNRVPLEYPFSLSVTTANVCNLKCEFCAISDINHKKNKNLLEFETLKLAVDSIHDSDWRLKQIVLVGLGEPLINKDITRFVSYIKKMNIAEKVHIVTNGTLLHENISDNLIEAGLDVLRVSINGLSDNDYLLNTGTKLDFENLVNNIKYYHLHKDKFQKIYIKIMNYMVDTQEKKELFHEIFEPICDVLNIEQLTEMSTEMDYEEQNLDYSIGLKGFDTVDTKICPLPFYHIYLNAEGTISACCVAGPWSTPPALVMGNLHENSMKEIWEGEKFNGFLISMLKYGKDEASYVCKKCRAYKSYIYKEDVLDSQADRIVKELENNIKKLI